MGVRPVQDQVAAVLLPDIMTSLSTTALIIFVRSPVYGKVKTRLARDIGDEKALEVYHLLLKHTYDITIPLNCRKFVYYADEVTDPDLWSNSGYSKKPQSGKDLGERMHHSFNEIFAQGFKKVLIIGSDCYQLTTAILEKAIYLLDQNSAILGPAKDGGYYLLGLRTFIPEVFTGKQWSTDQVAAQTINDFSILNIPFALLQELSDVDELSDLEDNHISI